MLTLVDILCAPEGYVFAVSVTNLGPVATLMAGGICLLGTVLMSNQKQENTQMSA